MLAIVFCHVGYTTTLLRFSSKVGAMLVKFDCTKRGSKFGRSNVRNAAALKIDDALTWKHGPYYSDAIP
jgi:hypothetical protein